MLRLWVLFLFVGGIVALLCAGVLVWINESRPANSEEDESRRMTREFIPQVEIPVLSKSTKVITNTEKRYSINIEYPSIALMNRPAMAGEVNDVVNALVNDMVESFALTASDTPLRLADTNGLSNDFTMRSNALLLSPTIISLRFDSLTIIAGTAQPRARTRMLNYDTEKHIILSTADLFASTTLAIPYMSEHARATLRKRFSDTSPQEQAMIIAGTMPARENFTGVGLTKEGLLMVFDPEQVAPYARGTQEVRIPLSELTDLLSANGLNAIRLAKENIAESAPEN